MMETEFRERMAASQNRLDMGRQMLIRLAFCLLAFMFMATAVLWYFSASISTQQRDLRSQIIQNRTVGSDNHSVLLCIYRQTNPCPAADK